MKADLQKQPARQEGELFRLLVENVKDFAIFVVNPEGRVQSWNPGAERLLGYRENEILGQSSDIFFTPEDIQAEAPRKEREQALPVGRGEDDRWHVRKDGSRFWSGGTMTPLWEGDKLRGFAKIMRDRTEWKRAEDERNAITHEAERRQRLYEATFSNTPDLVYVFDLDHRFTYANEGLLRMWGKTWDEAIGKNCLELGYEPWHAALHDREIEQVITAKQPIKGEVPFTGTFGRRIYEYIFVPVLGKSGEVEAVAGTTRDVTDRRQAEQEIRHSEERFRSLMEQAPFSIQVFSPDGRTIRVNRAWEELWGVRFEQITGYNILEDQQLKARGILSYIHRGFAGQTARIPAIEYNPNETIPDITGDADPRRWLSAVIYPIKDADGNVREVVLIHEDITAQKRAEEGLLDAKRELGERVVARTSELTRANEFLKALLENVQTGVVACNAEGTLTLFNGVTRELHGLPEEPLPPDHWAQRYGLFKPDGETPMPKDDVPLFRALHGEKVQDAEMVIVPVGGSPRMVEVSGRAFYGAQGEKLGAVVSMQDITARKQAERALRLAHEELEQRVAERTNELARANEALREADRQKDELLATLKASEQFHRAIADLSTDYAFSGTIGQDGAVHIRNVTEGFAKFYGISLEEMNAQGGWGSVIHPEDHPSVGKTIERLLSGRTDRGEVRALCKDGSVKWQSYLIVPVRDEAEGRTVGLYGAAADVTAQRELTERLREQADSLAAILSASVDNIYLFDHEGRYRYVSLGGARVLGFEPEVMTGKTWRELGLPAEIMEQFDAQRERAIATGESHRHDVSFTDGAGSVHHYEYVIAPVRSENGGFGGAVVVSRDDTERKRAEEALKDNDRRKDEFLATLAHELRNPLAPIRNALQILKMARVDEATAQQTREMMERQVHHLVRLVDDLLDVSRVMRGKIELRKEPVELATVVARAVETAKPLIEVQGHELEISLPKESLLLNVDPVRLAQVIGNLLTNAAKYTEANGRVWLSARYEGGEAVLSIRDNGIGVAANMLPHLFELFVQADPSSTKVQGGLGIGLTLVKNLVEMHGGTVEARSEGLGQGSEFIVMLPLLVQAHPEPRPEDNGKHKKDTPSTGQRLLVVDDNKDAANTLAMLLKLYGHDVRVAHNGPSALDAAKQHRPALIFLDIGMPGMDGFEVARRVRQLPELENVVLAALTGWGQEEDRRRTAEAGFNHHLVKPPEPKTLESLLAELKNSAK